MKVFKMNEIKKFDANMAKIGYMYDDIYNGDWYYRNKSGKEIRLVVGSDTIYGVIVNNEREFSASSIRGQANLFKKIVKTLDAIKIRKKSDEWVDAWEANQKLLKQTKK
jgi:hypothetical protein